ncbi:hypothetical protein ABZ371_23500 [Streptomyces sp. NPDC005899]|uniref:hypothetical protein n=1 Tax=Streptomyces sp. NPDC005899 TaxID=3155716 RepID=UPI00340E28DC
MLYRTRPFDGSFVNVRKRGTFWSAMWYGITGGRATWRSPQRAVAEVFAAAANDRENVDLRARFVPRGEPARSGLTSTGVPCFGHPGEGPKEH